MLAANGANVAVVARSMPDITKVVEELKDLGAEAIGVCIDVTSAEQLKGANAEVERELGAVDVLVLFAGGFTKLTPIWEMSEDEWHEVVDLNLTATFLTLRAFLPAMINRETGSIVMMASSSARVIDRPVTSSYAAAKAGVLMLMRHAALELGQFHIRVNAIAPGTVVSERVIRMTDDAIREEVSRLSPLGRLGSPEDCAAATLFLASEAAGWITGATLDVAGGRVMI
jgi:3-oxoacyl-[acyl-carrier protein] reductase